MTLRKLQREVFAGDAFSFLSLLPFRHLVDGDVVAVLFCCTASFTSVFLIHKRKNLSRQSNKLALTGLAMFCTSCVSQPAKPNACGRLQNVGRIKTTTQPNDQYQIADVDLGLHLSSSHTLSLILSLTLLVWLVNNK